MFVENQRHLLDTLHSVFLPSSNRVSEGFRDGPGVQACTEKRLVDRSRRKGKSKKSDKELCNHFLDLTNRGTRVSQEAPALVDWMESQDKK